MSVINLIFSSGAKNASIGGLTLDVTLSELHERGSDITESPVETGAVISDHIVNRPERVRIEGFITDTPAVIFAERNSKRVQNAFDTLDQLWKERTVIDVDCGLKTYTNMVISELQLPRGREQALRFSAMLQHIEVVASERATLAVVEADVDAAPRNEAGRQTTRETSAATEDRVSILEGGLRGLGLPPVDRQ